MIMPELATAPAPAAAAPSTAAPAANSGIRSTPNLDDVYSTFDKMGDDSASQPTPPPDKTNDTPNEDDASLETPATKPADKPKVEDPKPAQAKPPKAASLREAYDKLKTERAELDSKLKEYQDKEKSWKPNEEREKEYTAKLTAAEKRAQELEDVVKFADYSKSTEYQEQFVKPFNEAFTRGQKIAAQYSVLNEDGSQRKATAEDFNSIMAISDPDAAAAKIEELFGTGVKAASINAARQAVLEKYEARNNALNEWKSKSGEREKMTAEQSERFQQEMVKDWGDSVRSGQERLPEVFKPAEGANVENDILEQGNRLADLAFGALPAAEFDKLPDFVKRDLKNGQLHPKAKVHLHAAIRNKAGAFDRVVYQNKQMAKQLKDLQAKLDGFKKSEPASGVERGREAGESHGNTLDEIDKLFDAVASGRR